MPHISFPESLTKAESLEGTQKVGGSNPPKPIMKSDYPDDLGAIYTFHIFLVVRYMMLRDKLGMGSMKIDKEKKKIEADLETNMAAVAENYLKDSKFFTLFNALHKGSDPVSIEYEDINNVPLEEFNNYDIDEDKFVEAVGILHDNELARIEDGKLFVDRVYYDEFKEWAKTHKDFVDSAMDLALEAIKMKYTIRLNDMTDIEDIFKFVQKDILESFKTEFLNKKIKLFFLPPEVNDVMAFYDILETMSK